MKKCIMKGIRFVLMLCIILQIISLQAMAGVDDTQIKSTPFVMDYDPNDGKIMYGHSGEVGMRVENDINNFYENNEKVIYFPDDVMNEKDANGNPLFPEYDPNNPYFDYSDMLNKALEMARSNDNADVFVKEGVYYFTKSIWLFGYTNINAEAGKTAFVIKPNFVNKEGKSVDTNGFFANGDSSAKYSWYFGRISDIVFAVEGAHESFKPTSSVETIRKNICSDNVNAVKNFELFHHIRIKYGAVDNLALSGFNSFMRTCFVDMLTRVTSITVGPTRLVYYGVETNDAFFYDCYYYGGYYSEDDMHELPVFQINFSMGTTVFSNSYLGNYVFSRSGAGTWCPHTTYSNLTLERVYNFVIDTTVTSSSVSGCLFKDGAYNDIKKYFEDQGLEPYDHETRYYDHEKKKWMYPGRGYVIRDNIVGDTTYDKQHSGNHWDGQMISLIQLHSGIAFTQNKIECDSLDWTNLVQLTDSEWSSRYTASRGAENIQFSDNAFEIRKWDYENIMVDDWRKGQPYTEDWHDNTIIVWGEKGWNNDDGTPAMGWVGAEGPEPVCWLDEGVYVSTDLKRYIDLSAFTDKKKQGAGYKDFGDVGADEQSLWDAGLEDRYYKDMKSGNYEIVSFEEDFSGMGWHGGSSYVKLQKAFDYVATHDAILYIESGTYYTDRPIVLRGGKTYRVVFNGQIKSQKTDTVNGVGIFTMSADDNAPISGYFINPDLYMQDCNTSGFYNVNTDGFYMKVRSIARGVGAFTNCKLKNTVIHEGQIQYNDYGFFYKTVTDNILLKNVYGTSSTWIETDSEDSISPGDKNYRYFISTSDFANSTWKGCWLEFGQFSNGKTLTGAGNSLYRGNIIDYTYNYSFGKNDVVCGNTMTRANYSAIVDHMINSNFPIDKPDILTDKPMVMFHVSDGLRLIGNTDLGSMNHDTHFIEFDSPGISYRDKDGNIVKSISNARVAGNVVYTETDGEYKQPIPIMPFGKSADILLANCKNNHILLQSWYLRNQTDNPETEQKEEIFNITPDEVRSWCIPGVKTYVNREYLVMEELEQEPEKLEQIVVQQPAQDEVFDVPNTWLGNVKPTEYLLYDFKGRTTKEAEVLAEKLTGYIDNTTIVPYLRSQYNVASFDGETRQYDYNDIKGLSTKQRYDILRPTITYGLSLEEDFGKSFFMDGSREVIDVEGVSNNKDNKNRPTYAMIFRDDKIYGDGLKSVNASLYYDFKLSYAWQGKRPIFIVLSEDTTHYYGFILGYSCNKNDNGVFTAPCSFEKDYFSHLVDGRAERNNNFPQAHFENGISYQNSDISKLMHIDPMTKITSPVSGEQRRCVLGDYTEIPMFDGIIHNYASAVLGVDLTCEYDDDYKTVSVYATFDFSRIGTDTSKTPAMRAGTRKVWIGTYPIKGDAKIFGIWSGNKNWLQSVQFEYIPKNLSTCEHNFTDTVTREPNCYKEGVVRHTCGTCGYEYEEKTKPLGHKFWDKAQADGNVLRTCGECKLSFVTKGTTQYKCKHKYEKTVLQKENCVQDGAIHYCCSICEDSYTETTPALGHKYVDTVVPPTDTQLGYTLHVCSVCGEQYIDNYTGELHDGGLLGTVFKDKKGNSYKVIWVGSKNCVSFLKPKNKKVKSVKIPSKVTHNGTKFKVTMIANSAFKGCNSLKKVTIGSNVETIGKKAFYKCKKMTAIKLPEKVKKIGSKAFYGCSKLNSVVIKTSKLTSKSVGKSAFAKTYTRMKVKVPKKKLKEYKKLLEKKGVSKKATIK